MALQYSTTTIMLYRQCPSPGSTRGEKAALPRRPKPTYPAGTSCSGLSASYPALPETLAAASA